MCLGDSLVWKVLVMQNNWLVLGLCRPCVSRPVSLLLVCLLTPGLRLAVLALSLCRVPRSDLRKAWLTVTILLMDPTRAARCVLVRGNPLKVKCGTPAMMQLTVGLNEVGARLLATLPCSLLSAQLIVSPVVIPVTGKLAVPEVSVDECDMCGPTLTMIMWLLCRPTLNRMPELLALMLTCCSIVTSVLCTCRHLPLASARVGVIATELLARIFTGLRPLTE